VKRPSGPRVFITGASSGIGEALAREYAARGAVLGLTARRRDLLDRLAEELDTSVAVYPLDVRNAAALRLAAEDFMARFGGAPDIVIANAGVSSGTLTEAAEDLSVFQEIMDINVMGMVNTFHSFITAMSTRRAGSLVGIASVAGFRGIPGAAAYSASKAAAITYLESLRVELRGSGIAVTTICPGYIRTPMTAQNPYPMPFILDAGDAARRFIHAVETKKSFVTIPWQMALVGVFLRRLPNFLYGAVFSKAGRKPRRH